MEIKILNNEHYLLFKDTRTKVRHLPNRDDENEHYLGANFLIEDDRSRYFESIADISISELPESLCFNLIFENSIYPPLFNILINRKSDVAAFRANIAYDLESWDEDISAKKMAKILCNRIKELDIMEISEPFIELSSIYITLNKKINIKDTLRQEVEKICDLFSSIEKEILSNHRIFTGITAKLNILPKYSHIFAQYLMYFGQFLADMGIEAETSISNSNGLILLKIDPMDKKAAIHNIYIALNSYLSLADDEVFIKPHSNSLSQLKYTQLLNNVRHLKLQLSYTQEMLEIKNEHIDMLKHEQEFSRTYIVNQKSNVPRTVTEKWEPIDGLAITKYKGSFFEIDIPKIIKKLTRNKNK